ncbi:hypothetical protein [Ramlibacter sp.]|uniref:hypothetical protein n=1 Tax=Ramlibacter sp. TaxID=1917967 RepID=UPI003D0B7C13
MGTADYRIESNQPIAGHLWPAAGSQHYVVSDRSLAILLAAKSFAPSGDEIRVVHVPTGEVLYRKSAAPAQQPVDES